MSEYIKREAALMKLMQDGCNAKNLQSISDIPIADVSPVVHGRWIYDEKAQRPYCSVCKGYFYGATNSPMSYCPNCGAKMDGEPCTPSK